jgi:hypothetical protein
MRQRYWMAQGKYCYFYNLLTDTNTIYFCSMANPHVTGIAATLLSRKSYSNVEELYSDLVKVGTPNALSFKWSKVASPSHDVLAYVENNV